MNNIQQHILSRGKGYGSRAAKAEYQVPLEGSTDEKQALTHQLDGEKSEDQFREYKKTEEGKII